MAEDIRVGVIGFGLAGKIFHTAVIAETPGLELACIVQRKGDEAAKAYPGVAIARSIDEMLRDESIRLVVVGTPSGDHFAHALQCLEARRDVVVDKPFALTTNEAVRLMDVAKEKGRLLSIYQNRRWDGGFQTLKQVLASGVLGRVVTFEAHFDRYRAAPRLDVWRENGGPGGGLLFDLGSHLIDETTVLFGDPVSVWADVRVDREGAAVDDAFDVTLKFKGVTALLRGTLTAVAPGPHYVLHGTKGTFVKWGVDPQEDALKAGAKFSDPGFGEDAEANWGILTVAGEPERRIPTVKGDYRGYYANVRDALLGKAALEVTPRQALRTTMIIEMAQQSSREGRRLALTR